MRKNAADPEGYLLGTIESIVYYSPESGYTVCRFEGEDGSRLTMIGSFPPLSPGEMLKIRGSWEINPRFGPQLRVESYLPVLPASEKGIEKFLASGMINGIGPVLAGRIVAQFRDRTMELLTRNPDRLLEVEGVGRVKLRAIKSSWAEHEDIRELIVFLQEHGVSTTLATKIYRQYGQKSFHVLKTNPYLACHDIWGVGFKTADQIALKLGMKPDSPERVRAYIMYLMEKDTEQGNVFSLASELLKACCRELELGEDKFVLALETLESEKQVWVENIENEQRAVYLPFFHQAERELAGSLLRLARMPSSAPSLDVDKILVRVEHEMGLRFSDQQKRAIRESLRSRILVITGGPGTGKTTIIRGVVEVFRKSGRSVLLAAPTGRAAKRLAEATGREARTLHRTLEYTPKQSSFRKDEGNPLKGDALIIDEFSMVDLPLMHHLMKAVPIGMRLILVGDKDQLPSVGPGTLLRDIIQSGRVNVVTLERIFRQEKDSLITANAHRINRGEKILQPEKGDRKADFYFLAQEDEARVFELIRNLCAERIPRRLGLDPLSPQIQVISPMYRGLAGVDNLNKELQKTLNPHEEGLLFGNREFRVRDKVMQIRNNYDKDVFNGDIGKVLELDRRSFRMTVAFDGRPVLYTREEVNELVPAYAISVHKSQGSEYQAVVMPLLTQHFIMLQRNLFYTALTRAKKLSCIVGSYKALHIAIKNDKPVKRNTRLALRLRESNEPDKPLHFQHKIGENVKQN